MTEYCCPTCGTKLYIELSKDNDDDSEFVREKILQFVLGNEPYKGSIIREGKDMFRFHLQTYDSPDGDIWIYGTAKYSLNYGIPRFEISFDDKKMIR